MISAGDQPAFFPNAQNPTINGSTFTAVQGNAYFGSPIPSILGRRDGQRMLHMRLQTLGAHR